MASGISEPLSQASNLATNILNFGQTVEDAVVLKIGGISYDAFESMSIARDINALSSSFQISFADKWRQSNERWPLKPGELTCVTLGKNPIMNGFIDRLDVRVDNENRSLEISGRDKTGDLVDSSAGVNTQTQFKNATLTAIAQSYASLFGLRVTAEADVGSPFEKVSPEQDESVFEFLNRLALERGVLLISDLSGNLLITNRAGSGASLPSVKNPVESFDFTSVVKNLLQAGSDLVQGQNIISASATFDESNRFQQYVVKGQAKGTDNFNGVSVSQVSAAAIDSGVTRFRPKIVIAEGQVNIANAQKRAGWEAITRAADAMSIVVKVQGWTKADESPWNINELITLDAGFIGINPEMQLLITGVEFNKNNEEGTTTTLKLTRPDAFVSKPVVSSTNDVKSTLGWNQGALSTAANRVNEVVR